MKSSCRIIGHFEHADTFLNALRRLKKEEGIVGIRTFSPIPMHEVEQILGKKRSPIRFFSVFGVLFGGISAWLLASYGSLQYPLITGGKPIIAVPAFLVIVFEFMILFGALATILGLLIYIRLPKFRVESGYDSAFSVDQFGIRVRCPAACSEVVQQILQDSGADEVSHERH